MKKKNLFLLVLFVTVIFIPYQVQAQGLEIFRQEGIASWYGREYEGRPTASGEIFDASQLTAAHPSLPFGTVLTVKNLHNNRQITVRVNDRGPFVAARIIDVSRAAAEQLDMIVTGTAPVIIESVDRIAVSSPIAQPQAAPRVVSPIVGQVGNAAVINEPANPPANQPVNIIQPPANANVLPADAIVYISQSAAAQTPAPFRLAGQVNIMPAKTYRLQIGSYRIARNAVEAFERLRNSGLNPAYERYADGESSEYFRVVLAGVRGTDVQSTTERLSAAGFREALIREEN